VNASEPDEDAPARPASDELLPAERKVIDSLGHLPLDFRAMSAVSNLFRSSTAIRRHMEANVLAADRLSWTAFTGLWVLWIWGEMEARDFAAAVGISRPTATGVVTTLEGRGLVRRRRDERDGRMVLVSLTPTGRRRIEDLFPRLNAEEVALTSSLTGAEQETLAGLLRSLLRAVDSTGVGGGPSGVSGTGRNTRAPSP
jgi:DNA-binding MarR family transcriptional regulator